MQLGATSGPLLAKPSFRLGRTPSISRFFPLNSSFQPRASTLTAERPPSLVSSRPISSTDSSLRTHISNLDKLLLYNQRPLPPDGTDPATPRESQPRGVLHGFNLAGIWPGSKQIEEMSPRNLNKLKRLLSRTNDYSPRNSIAARWADYHGRHDWAGLLDPLDENLRREIVRYGEFVQGAYHTFNSDPATTATSAPGDRLVSIPDRAFRVTCNLYATSSLRIPEWVQDMAPEWMTQRSSWVGYVAVCDDPREIARMGRRDIVIALRGTSTCLEWAENARANLVSVPAENGPSQQKGTEPKVECGFWSLYKTRGAHVQSLSESILEEVKRLMEQYKGEQLSITVTGHSLGAALALLAADELSTCEAEGVPPIAVISFGGPRVGNRGFVDRVRDNGVKVLRVVNTRDVITRVPGLPVDEGSSHVHDAWGYSHVGSELRLDSKASPFLRPDADVACCHDLEAYLHLVDGFLGSNCPFRDNAKRPIWKLLNEQTSNVKKLYASKAKDLTLSLERVRMQTVGCLASPS